MPEICNFCQQEIYIGDDDHEHCGCDDLCPCGCGNDITLCVYRNDNRGAVATGGGGV